MNVFIPDDIIYFQREGMLACCRVNRPTRAAALLNEIGETDLSKVGCSYVSTVAHLLEVLHMVNGAATYRAPSYILQRLLL